MYGHPVVRELEAWWQEHGGRHDSPEWHAYVADLQSLLAIKADEITSEHVNLSDDGRKVFGMSKAGGCTRAASLKVLGHEVEPFTGSSLATFHIGHLLECMAIATMRAAGYEVDGAQEPVTIAPFMASFSDGIIRGCKDDQRALLPQPTLLSVKTTGYKKSSQSKGKWVRQGFPALPFEGIRKGQPSWWAQAQAEMHGSGIRYCLVLVVAKDIIKSMEKDPYLMGEGGNGSLTFYAELIEYDPLFCETQLVPVWTEAWARVNEGRAAAPYFLGPESKYVRLPVAGDTASGWGGPNQAATGTFNPCGACEMAAACKAELAREYRGATAHSGSA
jgi:hypothetical protein